LSTIDHRIAFANDRFIELMGFNNLDEAIGSRYNNMKCKAAEDYREFENQDKIVINNSKKISILGHYHYADDWQLVLCEKSILLNDNDESIGIIFYALNITNSNIIDYSRFIFNTSKKIYQTSKRSFSYIIDDGSINTYKLSKRQIGCLFFLLRGRTNKEISNILGLSSRTVESYINEIKLKMKCLTKGHIVAKSLEEELFNIIPENFIKGTFDK
jgi:DNA-binding CsgD family transcriptional regulator